MAAANIAQDQVIADDLVRVLSVTKTDGAASAVPGSPISYTDREWIGTSPPIRSAVSFAVPDAAAFLAQDTRL